MSQTQTQTQTPSADQERYSRRLSDKIQAAFDHACDEGELQVAADLLVTLELVLLRVAPKPDRREAIVAPLMASHARLWHLRSKSQDPDPALPAEPAPPQTPETSQH
jgi:hypothetical protein